MTAGEHCQYPRSALLEGEHNTDVEEVNVVSSPSYGILSHLMQGDSRRWKQNGYASWHTIYELPQWQYKQPGSRLFGIYQTNAPNPIRESYKCQVILEFHLRCGTLGKENL